ncbi:MAG: BTAD domain-containing putative transcriptional regulator [Trueperaceae bacterium]
MVWQLRVLGEASLERAGRRVVPERKTAALLAVLALEGAAGRSRLAGLLWPDSGEERARGNLRQLLRRLRTSAGDDLLDTADLIRLLPHVEVDVVKLQAAAVFEGIAFRATVAGELLAGHDYDDCPELLEWLTTQRERLVALRRELLEDEIERRRAEHDHAGALRLAERLLELDPLSEEAYRRIMRLHYLSGDRAAALRAFGRCRDTVQRELGVDPLPETVALAAEIEREPPSLPGRGLRPSLPLVLERPPLLAGRDAEWGVLENAWRRGQVMVVCGEPGMGKTRLLLDFVSQHGQFVRFGARPGDKGIPYALFSRGWRDLLIGEGGPRLADWTRRELARLVPELEENPLGPLAGEEDKTRLLEAKAEAFRAAAAAGYSAVVVDDLHYADEASFEALGYMLAAVPKGDQGPRWLLGYRTGELEPAQERRMQELLATGAAAMVELRPLRTDAIDQLLGGLSLQTSSDLARPLARYTGGNPLFIVETLKSLAETGGLELPFPARLRPPRQLGAIVAQRLDRLTPGALRLARAVAVLEDAFDLKAAGYVLDSDPFELAQPLMELEGAQLVNDEGFSHDLVHQAVLDGTPAAARRLLHHRVALYLEGIPVPPALIARHFMAAGDELRAAPFLKEAGDSAAAAYRLDEAAACYRQAAELLERNRDSDGSFAVLSTLVELFLKRDYGPDHAELERSIFRLARSPDQLAVAWQTRALFLQLVAKAEESEAAAREGHRHALASGDVGLQVELLNNVVGALWLQDRIDETVTILDEAISLGEQCDDPLRLSESLANMGVILDHLDRHREAIEYHSRAAALRAQHGGRLGQIQVMGNLAVSQAELGHARDSLATAERMLLLLDQVHGANDLRVHALLAAGAAARDLGSLQSAMETLGQALELAEELNTWIVGPARRHLALAHTIMGRFDEARVLLEAALAQPNMPRQFRSSGLQALAVVLHAQGEDPTPLLAEAEEQLSTSGRPLRRAQLLIVKALVLPAEAALAAAYEALELARSHELGGLRIAARTRCAQASLALGCTGDARAHADSAALLLARYDPADFYLAEVLFTRYRALAAAGATEATIELERCVAWVEGVARTLDSEEARDRFLNANPVNRELLRTARSLGIGAKGSIAS